MALKLLNCKAPSMKRICSPAHSLTDCSQQRICAEESRMLKFQNSKVTTRLPNLSSPKPMSCQCRRVL